MRHPRLNPPDPLPPLVAVAHGSKDPRAAAAVNELVSLVRSRSSLDVRAAFLDHCAPSLPQALGSLGPDAPGVVVPLLLTAAYHSKTDIPAQLAAAGGTAARDIRCAEPLGPHPLLLRALRRRLAEAGAGVTARDRARTSVVLAAAGSADTAATATVAALAGRWQAAAGWRRVVPAFASAAGPRPAEAVRALLGDGGPVVVASYLLAPGYFADKVRDTALEAGAHAVSAVLGAAPEVAGLVLDRYQAAVRAEPSVPLVARAQLSGTDGGDCPVNGSPRGGKPNKGQCPGRAAQVPCRE